MAEGSKSVWLAYFLWLIGGGFGLHLFYLGRDKQGFVWWATWGGFGLGWLRDILYIPQYVGLANSDHRYIEAAKRDERHRLEPAWSSFRFCGEVFFGAILGFITQYAIPDEFLQISKGNPLTYILLLIGPFGAGLGVYIVANIGREQCSWKYPIFSAYLAVPLIYFEPTNLLWSSVAAAVVTSWKGSRWRPISSVRSQRHFCKRLPTLTVCGMIYLSLWGSMIYFNATITTKEGDEVKVREAVQNFFKSPAWLEMKDIMKQLYDNIQTVGWQKFFETLIESIDPQGESNALKVLGLESDATQKDITMAYRKLAKTWHPDKHKDPESKKVAQEKFIEIQRAYDTLSDIKAKRSARSHESQPQPN